MQLQQEIPRGSGIVVTKLVSGGPWSLIMCAVGPPGPHDPVIVIPPSQAPSVFLSGSYEETGLHRQNQDQDRDREDFGGKTKKKTHGQPRWEERIAKIYIRRYRLGGDEKSECGGGCVSDKVIVACVSKGLLGFDNLGRLRFVLRLAPAHSSSSSHIKSSIPGKTWRKGPGSESTPTGSFPRRPPPRKPRHRLVLLLRPGQGLVYPPDLLLEQLTPCPFLLSLLLPPPACRGPHRSCSAAGTGSCACPSP